MEYDPGNKIDELRNESSFISYTLPTTTLMKGFKPIFTEKTEI